jgi:sulfopropanediol 3-dehydrogenase
MATYVKQAIKTAQSSEADTRETVAALLQDIKSRGESAVRELAHKFDGWTGDLIVSAEEQEKIIATVPQQVRDDIRFAYDMVYGFAVKQRENMQSFETEIYPGVTLGQRLVPCQCAGCYIPGGRFAHAASSIMSVATAKAAGVPFVVACSPPRTCPRLRWPPPPGVITVRWSCAKTGRKWCGSATNTPPNTFR